jgi:integrase
MATKAAEGLQTKTISNHLNFAHGLFAFAVKRGWASTNPVADVDRPRVTGTDPDIRYLDRDEIEALLRAVPDDWLGPTDRALYLAATMAGLRQGELIALRWQDVDWIAGVIRVRRSFTRGQFGTPKSRRSSRAVPMADRLGAELDRHFQGSAYQADSDLVFCHPETGNPYDASKMRKRFRAALKAAGVRSVRFHDLRHSYGTAMAAAGAPLRALQEWMGHRDYKTTSLYADFAPDRSQGATWAEAAFGFEDNEPAEMPGEGDHLSASDIMGSTMGETPAPTSDGPSRQEDVTQTRPGSDRGTRTIDVGILGGRKLTGRWRPATRMTSVSVLGGCHIDLREAEIADDGVTIIRFALVGGTHVIVPDGVAIQLDGFSVLGGRRVDSHADPSPTRAPLVRLRVFSLVGGVKVESEKVG